ncbi:heparinase II/III family protein [Laetiporus sulphureus 93-53]|uniref:Heparinase II/III family protein n=1 Tax=Laetiporus sulphureus 93-53 TaxID=1314785 RepID=A0A165C944_9APHY|nr:heparinase II/III family protein [Laetiporus sulphureus 93-53]KZT02413.1 heparinase II/III family protein [Laetiporus sulphureus 93-53]
MAYAYAPADSTNALQPEVHSPGEATPRSDPYYNESRGFISSSRGGKKKHNYLRWFIIAVPILIAIILAAVLGGVLGSRAHHHTSASSSRVAQASASSSESAVAAASSAASVKEAIGVFATGTDSVYMLPLYPSTTNTAAFTKPTFQAEASGVSWPTDPWQPSNPSPTEVRPNRPRIIAPQYKWDALPNLIKNEPYLKLYNDTIFGNATEYYNQDVVAYFLDSGNGILDIARQIKMRIKAFSYAYRMTNDTKWSDRAFQELQNAAGNGTNSFGPDDATRWNPTHFLDTAEMTAAFAIAYDWMYDAWSDTEKSQILWTMVEYGLNNGVFAYTNSNDGYYGWWTNNTQGNWNCVCNGGLTMGALAILGDDTSGLAEQILGYTIPNAILNCAEAVTSDGTWQETPNYWYFGVTGHAEMISSLVTATGSDYDLLSTNPGFEYTGLFHMHVTGPGSMFEWGDNGVNLYSTTANPMFFYAEQYNHPEYMLFQRDQHDAPSDPWSMFWYNPSVSGAFWDGLNLDGFFDNHTDQWGSMRTSWTDEDALFIAMKAGMLQGHQTHNDLDCGDFVLDALGTRWAGELGDENYLDTGYFSNDTQESDRWLYYRKRTEGQNTILVNYANQLVTATPTIRYGTDNTTQGSSTVFSVPDNSTAFFTADLASAYENVTSFQRGIRMINSRKQVLLQDDITADAPIQWRMHTNATVTVNSEGNGATLQIGNEKLELTVLSPSSGYKITTETPAARLSTDPPLPSGQTDLPNTGVTVIMISLDAGTYSLQVLFNPQWSDMSSSEFVTPPSVSVSDWTLTSHN